MYINTYLICNSNSNSKPNFARKKMTCSQCPTEKKVLSCTKYEASSTSNNGETTTRVFAHFQEKYQAN